MSKPMALCVVGGLVLGSPSAMAQDQKTVDAMNSAQSEISMCISYYILLKGCVGDRDRSLPMTPKN
jgi:hypothetical protein